MASTALPFIAEGWIVQALTSKLGLLLAGIILLSVVILGVLVRATIRLGRASRQNAIRSLAADSRGTTSIEFALVCPILLILSLVLVQSMMLMAGNMYVHYAAYQATRQATIEIPQDYSRDGDQPANHYSPSGLKYERIRQAAYMSLVPVAGQLESGSGPADAMVAAIRSHYSSFGATEPAWVESMLAAKVYYAEANTEIEVVETNVISEDDVTFDPLPESPYRFGVRDVVTVNITHKLNLGVPFASRFFADGDNGAKGPGRYTLVSAHATLPNEGVPVPLPVKPDIDRVTPPLQPINNNPNDPNNPINPIDP